MKASLHKKLRDGKRNKERGWGREKIRNKTEIELKIYKFFFLDHWTKNEKERSGKGVKERKRKR